MKKNKMFTKVTNWFLHKIKRLYLKYYIKVKKMEFPKNQREENGYERICLAICRETINHPDSKFSIAPISNKRYIVNKTLDIFIIMEDSRVEVTNHVYHYDVFFTEKQIKKLINHFDRKVEQIRLDYEEQIRSQVKNTLEEIYKSIKDKNIAIQNTNL